MGKATELTDAEKLDVWCMSIEKLLELGESISPGGLKRLYEDLHGAAQVLRDIPRGGRMMTRDGSMAVYSLVAALSRCGVSTSTMVGILLKECVGPGTVESVTGMAAEIRESWENGEV